jgi:8-oxo-dGTP pyrophosphatase MutT (NUDIX family)
MTPRRTARIYVFDPDHRVLLIHFIVPRPNGPFAFWLTPGGEIEPGESPAQAAARELHEELALTVPVHGPVYTERNQFEHEGELRDNTDFFFTAHCEPEAPRLTGLTPAEMAIMHEARWWSPTEISHALVDRTRFFPADIVSRVIELGAQIGVNPPHSAKSVYPQQNRTQISRRFLPV